MHALSRDFEREKFLKIFAKIFGPQSGPNRAQTLAPQRAGAPQRLWGPHTAVARRGVDVQSAILRDLARFRTQKFSKKFAKFLVRNPAPSTHCDFIPFSGGVNYTGPAVRRAEYTTSRPRFTAWTKAESRRPTHRDRMLLNSSVTASKPAHGHTRCTVSSMFRATLPRMPRTQHRVAATRSASVSTFSVPCLGLDWPEKH